MPFYRQGELEGKESEKGRFLPVFGSADRHVRLLRSSCRVFTAALLVAFDYECYCFRSKTLLFSSEKSIVCMFEGDKRRESSLE